MNTTEEYQNIGMICRKVSTEDYDIIIPQNITRCNNDEENYYYETEFGDVLYNSFIDSYVNDTDLTIAFVTPIKELEEKYINYEDAIIYYQENIKNKIYIQTTNYKNNSIDTYQFDLNKSTIKKIAVYKDGEFVNINEEETTIQNKKEVTLNKESKENKKNSNSNKKENNKTSDNNIKIDMKKLYTTVKKSVIGQDDALKKIVTILDQNYHLNNYRNKTNILLVGPSGSGKTEIFRTITETLNIPIVIEDSEQYSAVGYYGASITDMLVDLYYNSNENLEKAQKGILVIDEIDKKLTGHKGDVSGERILTSLLSLMEGNTFTINISKSPFSSNSINFDTRYLTVILLGACADILKTNKSTGFGQELSKKEKYKDITLEKLKKYGFKDETLRRIDLVVLNELTEDTILEIMKKGKNSTLKEKYSYAKKKNTKLHITEEALKEIAKKAYLKQTGVSAIKSTLNEILNDAFFEVGMNPNTYSKIEVTKDTINQEPPYKLIKKRKKNTSK